MDLEGLLLHKLILMNCSYVSISTRDHFTDGLKKGPWFSFFRYTQPPQSYHKGSDSLQCWFGRNCLVPTPCRVRSQQPLLPVPSIWSFIFIASFVLVAIKSLVTFPFTLSSIEDIKISGHFANPVLDIIFDVLHVYSYLTCLPVRNALGSNLTDFMCTSLASFAINYWVFNNSRMQIIIFELLKDRRALPLSVHLGYRPRLWPGNEWSMFALPSQ